MSKKTTERMEKFVALCDSGKPWYVFLAVFGVLLVASLLVELLTDQHMKWWAWVIDIVGIINCLLNIRHCKKLQAEKKKDDAE